MDDLDDGRRAETVLEEIGVAVVDNPTALARWKEAAQPVIARWIAEMEGKGIDGQALIDRAKSLIAEKSA